MKKKILIIEDNRPISSLLCLALTRKGYETFASYNSKDGLKKLQKIKFDLIILDVMIPGMNGFEVLEHIKQIDIINEIPVIMCTEKNLVGDIDRALNAGANDYITKPFDIERVLEKIENILV
ncbi:MAG: hypothetical protein A3J83_04105 [Elusimicrobia bacterium RIFOXYA2_FULL_40_6]|nr:MAG: hypothetical protein A3J83_04105 [Elusimicrobia bacterium RIFOXYA2_FULL_40_6]